MILQQLVMPPPSTSRQEGYAVRMLIGMDTNNPEAVRSGRGQVDKTRQDIS
jgi:hypothetical protein